MGCGPSNSAAVPVDGDSTSMESKTTFPPPEAFEIPLDDENPESLIKKHPPKRLQRLEETPSTPPTIEDLEEKLATAEMRRLQFLATRSQKTQTLDKPGDEENGDVNVIKEEDETEEMETAEEAKCDEPEPEKEEKKTESTENG